jgi:hypothetical protein
MGIGNAFETTRELVAHYKKHAAALSRIKRTAQRQIKNNDYSEEAQEELRSVSAEIPVEDAKIGISLQGRLHAEVLSVILNSCFTLESYINSLRFFLLKERHITALVSDSTINATDDFDRMSTLSKWETIGKLNSDSGFDTGSSPFQELKVLFRFRDDHVHDKVVEWGEDRSRKRYNNKLPDPLGGLLSLSNGVFACDTYWAMIIKVHKFVGVPTSEFHKHYNLKPWFDAQFENQVKQAAAEYDGCLEG